MSPEDPTRTEEQLSAYLDGQLDGPERAAIEHRLETDDHLRKTLNDLEATVRMVGALPAEPSPPGLRDDTLAMLERDMLLDQSSDEPVMLPDQPRRVWRWLATAAVLTMASTAGYFTLQQVRTGATDSDSGATRVAMNQQPEPPALPQKEGRGPTLDRPSDTKSEPDRDDARRGRSAAFNAAVTANDADVADASATLNATYATKPPSPALPPPAQDRPAQPDLKVAKATPTPDPVPPSVPESIVTARAPQEVRLAVQASRPAHVYAMLARTRSFAANERMRLIDVPSSERSRARRRMVGAMAWKGEDATGGAGTGARRQITLLARRSQLVGLLGELHRQDGEASVQMKVGQSRSVGWEQVLAAAGRVGAVEVELPARVSGFAGMSSLLGETSSYSNGTLQKAQTQVKEKARGEFPEPKHFVDRRMIADADAGASAKSQPAIGATAQPLAARRAQRVVGATWADNLMRLLSQADAAIDPDPVVRIYLTVTVLPVAGPSGPQRFEDAPEMGLGPHGPKKQSSDKR